jgi:predicted RNA-binding Zn-ribbon protein involved in translation (DUF1610 family)
MGTDAFTCPQCGDTFPTEAELSAHEHSMPLAWERGSTPFTCTDCGVSFDEPDELLTHQSEAHSAPA